MNNSQCMPVKELIARLKMDPALIILFVEGARDLAFWRKYAPIGNRINSVVYSASLIFLPDACEGGEKGKLLKLVEILDNSDIFNISNRVKVFVDADNDRLLGTLHLSNVVLTDYRDLESYAFNDDTLIDIVHTGLAKTHLIIQDLINEIKEFCLPISGLRLVSERDAYKLAFQRTFENGKRKKYIVKNANKNVIDSEALIATLMQNGKVSLSKKVEIKDKLVNIIPTIASVDLRQILHGKDWTFFLAHLCNVNLDVIEPLVFLGINYDELDLSQNIASVKQYLYGQAATTPQFAASL